MSALEGPIRTEFTLDCIPPPTHPVRRLRLTLGERQAIGGATNRSESLPLVPTLRVKQLAIPTKHQTVTTSVSHRNVAGISSAGTTPFSPAIARETTSEYQLSHHTQATSPSTIAQPSFSHPGFGGPHPHCL